MSGGWSGVWSGLLSSGTQAVNKVIPWTASNRVSQSSEYEEIGDNGSQNNKIKRVFKEIIITCLAGAVFTTSLAMIIAPLIIMSKEKTPDYSPLKYIAPISFVYGAVMGGIGYAFWKTCKKYPLR
ncbi:MAG: hypothetical protein K1060chlam1_00103 [Candidatus Anoxychlamydiales bacterium]|nr:hypothetical protein [Candidatus Anoxychlamydiales bacterium]